MSKEPADINDVTAFQSRVKVGHIVPDYEFEIFHDEKVKEVRFSDYKGKWVILVFYPADFTFVCPTELEELAVHYKSFQELEAEVISVSADTVFTHKAWHDTSPAIKKIQYPMGADPAGRLARAFGVYIEPNGLDHVEDEGLSLRGTFVIDPDGILRTMEIHDNAIGRSAKELVRKLQAAQYVRTHGGQVCPAEWNPGDDTLKGGDMNLVGKI
ncbi:redoxin domain-containing protein [Patescibacteria group bacterium]|nr:redoxin domain-containing protein [Patescibacteria group bacterium]